MLQLALVHFLTLRNEKWRLHECHQHTQALPNGPESQPTVLMEGAHLPCYPGWVCVKVCDVLRLASLPSVVPGAPLFCIWQLRPRIL